MDVKLLNNHDVAPKFNGLERKRFEGALELLQICRKMDPQADQLRKDLAVFVDRIDGDGILQPPAPEEKGEDTDQALEDTEELETVS